jgi:hypothetical protein
MNNDDLDHLLERSLSGDPPGQVFRARVLLDSTEAFVLARQSRARWRLAALSVAAVFIAAVSFLLGRSSVPPAMRQPMTEPAVASAAGTVAVPSELVAWLQAARFFGQLGMEDRVALAYDRASKLVPYEAAATFASSESHDTGMPASEAPSSERIKSIIAQSFGGQSHANVMH